MVLNLSESLLSASPLSRSAPSTPTYGSLNSSLVRRKTTLALCDDQRPRELSGKCLGDIRDSIAQGLNSYHSNLNILLVFVPIGIIGGFFKWNENLTFVANFIAMIPLAMILGRATEDVGEHTNQSVGALCNVTFGNAVELILSISALRAGRFDVVRNTLIGSILSNLLLVLGSAFFAGGIAYKEQTVLRAVSESNTDLLAFCVFAFAVPVVFRYTMTTDGVNTQLADERLSLVISLCMLAIYILYLVFQLVTHSEFYDGSANLEDGGADMQEPSPLDAEAREPASLSVASTILAITICVVAVCSEFLIDTLDKFAASAHLSSMFIAVVLLPLIGNAVEHMSAILVAFHNRIDLAVGIACGSSVQIAMFVGPVMVLISYMFAGEKLTLDFGAFNFGAFTFSVFVVNATLSDSKTNLLEGAVLVACYVVLAAAYFLM